MNRPRHPRLGWPLVLALMLIVPPRARANLVVNGSFETGPDPTPSEAVQLAAGSTAITGWLVTRTNIDYCTGTRWTAAQGGRSLGLNGSLPGGIAQTFVTQAHAQYTVRFYMCGDPFTSPAIKVMRVAAAGQSADFEADNTGMWPWDPGWNWHAWTFTATGSSTQLEFYSLMSGDAGPALDSVTVEVASTLDAPPLSATDFALAPLAPNPTHDVSQIEFSLPGTSPVRLSVFDLGGREVATIADGVFEAGVHRVTWDARSRSGGVPPGLYFVQMRTPGRQLIRRLMVVR